MNIKRKEKNTKYEIQIFYHTVESVQIRVKSNMFGGSNELKIFGASKLACVSGAEQNLESEYKMKDYDKLNQN